MKYDNPLGIEYRVVGEAEREGKLVRIVSGSRVFDAEIEALWDAVTNPERIPRWFTAITGDLKLGGQYQLKDNAGGKITRCDAPTAFDITWEYSGNVSWVTVRLETVAQGTRLTLEHIMGKDEESETHWKMYGPGATGVGWELGFLGLGIYLQSGEPVVVDESYAWMASSDGKAFIKKCAKEWGEAHVRSGEDRTIAVAMAAATAAFYCGEQQHEQ